MEVDECYICNDTKNDTLMTNICDCRERFIHKTCFVNLLQKTKFDNSCSVCKKKIQECCYNQVLSTEYKTMFNFHKFKQYFYIIFSTIRRKIIFSLQQ